MPGPQQPQPSLNYLMFIAIIQPRPLQDLQPQPSLNFLDYLLEEDSHAWQGDGCCPGRGLHHTKKQHRAHNWSVHNYLVVIQARINHLLSFKSKRFIVRTTESSRSTFECQILSGITKSDQLLIIGTKLCKAEPTSTTTGHTNSWV